MSSPSSFWRRYRHPWIWMFVIVVAFQVFRGSIADALIFGSFAGLAILSQSGRREQFLRQIPHVTRKQVLIGVAGLAVVMTALPRHSVAYGLLFLLIGCYVILTSWYADSGAKERRNLPVSRATVLWRTYGIALCLWELAANILGQLNNTLSEFPTISVLVDPMLDHPLGKAGFVLLWLMSGVGFMRLWRVR